MKTIEICEVGPRDGLQIEDRIWSVDERVQMIDRLSSTGLGKIEAVSFVNPKRVPQMADPEIVMERINRPDGVAFAGLALNLLGVERAIACGMNEVRCVVVASESFNKRNQGATIDETLKSFEAIAEEVHKSSSKLAFGIGAAFGCPFEGTVDVAAVAEIVRRIAPLKPQSLFLADTIGCAVPTQVAGLLHSTNEILDDQIMLGCHFHNTRNTGYANAVTAIEAGADFLDASIAGLGGCPFAPKATGNIATEDLCFMLRNMGYETGVNLERLIDVSEWIEGITGRDLPGQISKAGVFPEMVSAT